MSLSRRVVRLETMHREPPKEPRRDFSRLTPRERELLDALCSKMGPDGDLSVLSVDELRSLIPLLEKIEVGD